MSRGRGVFWSYADLLSSSVSSVKTLEEAKVARGCLYMQMPVQEVLAYATAKFPSSHCHFTVWYPAIQQVRGNSKDGLPCCKRNPREMGRGRLPTFRLHRREEHRPGSKDEGPKCQAEFHLISVDIASGL